MNDLLKSVEQNQEQISIVADKLFEDGFVGCDIPCCDRHPAWPHTVELPNSICRIVAIQVAENRLIDKNKIWMKSKND
jgi:hypothetical protein